MLHPLVEEIVCVRSKVSCMQLRELSEDTYFAYKSFQGGVICSGEMRKRQ
jgi:hypothetical protein